MSRFLVLFIGTSFLAFVSGCGGGSSSSPSSSSSDTSIASAPATAPSPSAATGTSPGGMTGAPGGMTGAPGGMTGAPGGMTPEMMKMAGQGGGGDIGGSQPNMEEMMKKMYAENGGGGDVGGSSAPANMEEMMKKMAAQNGGQIDGSSAPGNMEEMMKKMAAQGGTAPGPGQTTPEMMLAMANGGAPGSIPGGVPKARPEPKTFKEKSDYAFEDGLDSDAFQYLFAHYLTDPSGINEQQMYWVPGLEAPRTVIRWGVAIDYSAPKSYEKAPPKIGSQPNVLPGKKATGGQQPGQFPGGQAVGVSGVGGPMTGMGGQGGATEPVDPLGKLTYYTGDIGTRIVEELDKRRTHNNAFFGAALQQVSFELPTAESGGNAFGGAGADPRMMQMMAGVGASGVGAPGIGAPQGNVAAKAKFDSTQLIPGVVFLGMGDSPEMLKEAQANSVDLMLFFSVKVGVVAKTGLETNNTQVSLYNVNTGRTIYKQRTALNNVAFWTAKEKNNDLIETLIEELFIKLVDEKFVMQEMPQWQESEIFERVKQLVVDKEYTNPLPALAEVCYYHESGQKLLPDNAYNSAVTRLIGRDNAERFLNGNGADKAKAIARWLPPKWRPTTIGGEFKN